MAKLAQTLVPSLLVVAITLISLVAKAKANNNTPPPTPSIEIPIAIPPAHAPHHHHHHHHYHSHPPASAPASPPPHPAPTKPLLPPSSSPKPTLQRSLVAVQGVVFCKSCFHPGLNSSWGTPILGATVKLECKNTKYRYVQTAATDKNGYYIIFGSKKLTTFGAHTCRVKLVSSPLQSCQTPSNLHSGVDGATLTPDKTVYVGDLRYVLHSVGLFAFEPKCKV